MDGVRSNLGWRSSWWMVLWAGAILHCSFLMAQVEIIPIDVVPQDPMETSEVLLSVPIPSNRILFCIWYYEEEEIATVFPNQEGGNKLPEGHERITVYHNCSLHIKELLISDSGNYSLIEGGIAESNAGRVFLNVVEIVPKPNVIIIPTPFLLESQSVQLRCNTTITQDVSWFKDGSLLFKGHDLTDSNRILTIHSVTRTDTGQYKCRVSNGVTAVESDPEHLSVIYGPELPVIMPNNACYGEDLTIILTCQAASFPEPQYTWFLDGVPREKGPKLFIQNFNESQAGAYTCEAVNELLQRRIRSDIQHIHLEKSCVSEVTITGPSEGIETTVTSLNCTAKGDDVHYSWIKGNQVVNENDHISLTNEGQTITFNPCFRSDAAKYKCHAFNNYSSGDSEPFALSIIYGPDPPFINETIDIKLEKISLTCVAVSFPATQNQWFYNGDRIEENPKVLTLNIVKENSGNYTCKATNPKSGVLRETTLEIDMIGKLETMRRR